MKKTNSKKIIIAGSVLIILAAGIFFFARNKKEVVSYSEYAVERSTIDLKILSTGTVQPKNRLEIKAPVAGRIEEVLTKEGTIVEKGQLLAWMSSTERAAMLDAARSKGEAEFKRWSELYLPTPVLAPIRGTIILKNVEPGQTFTNNDAIFTMSDHLTVKAQVDETDIAQIKLGSKAVIVLDAYPNSPINAHVDQLAFDATTVNNVTTYSIDVKPETTPEFMRSGMTANVTFFVSSKENILVIPSEALRVQEGNSLVLIKGPNGPQMTTISTGITDGRNLEVTSGLKENDIVLIQDYSLGNSKESATNPFGPQFPKRGSGNRSGGNSRSR